MNTDTEVFTFVFEYVQRKLKCSYSYLNTCPEYSVFMNTFHSAKMKSALTYRDAGVDNT